MGWYAAAWVSSGDEMAANRRRNGGGVKKAISNGWRWRNNAAKISGSGVTAKIIGVAMALISARSP